MASTVVEEQMRIFEYAKVADWDSRLQTLATMAEPEPWNYRSVPSLSPAPVLDAYIRYTFLRVHDQQRITEAAELACFNTGLLTQSHEQAQVECPRCIVDSEGGA